MKPSILLILALLISQLLLAQEKERNFEIGVTLANLNLDHINSLGTEPEAFQFLNELFLRYRKGDWVLRANTSYFQYKDVYNWQVVDNGCTDCDDYKIDRKDFKIGLGVQHSILTEKDWLYGFANLSYHFQSGKGNSKGTDTGEIKSIDNTSHGIYSTIGLGFKVKIIKRLYLSPELGMSIILGKDVNSDISGLKTDPILKFPLTYSL